MRKILALLILVVAVCVPDVAAKVMPIGLRTTAKESRADEPTYTEWETCLGSWVYVSNYVHKSYPSAVSSRRMMDDGKVVAVQYKISNALFKDAILTCEAPEYGGCIYMYAEDGSPIAILDDAENALRKYIEAVKCPAFACLSNIMQYVAAESFNVATSYYTKDENGQLEILAHSNYDYIYNTEATSVRIDAELPRMADGPITISGSCGSGVTDLYYVLALSNRNQEAADEYGPEGEQYGFALNFSTMPGILADYISTGKMNPAIKIGKIQVDASGRFTAEIPEIWEGQYPLSLIALKNGVVCAQKFQIVEMHSAANWRPYKGVELTLGGDLLVEPVENKMTIMEINEKAKLLRVVGPYGDEESDFNYIYFDYTLGMDKCFVANSYTDMKSLSEYYDVEGNTKQIEILYYMVSVISCNLWYGHSLPYLCEDMNDPMFFFNLNENEVSIASLFYQFDIVHYMSDRIEACGFATLQMKLTDLAEIEKPVIDTNDAPVEYFNLTGLRIATPERGSICIERRGPEVRKIVF